MPATSTRIQIRVTIVFGYVRWVEGMTNAVSVAGAYGASYSLSRPPRAGGGKA